MADLNAVYKALEKAHAAGDTESAKTLADYLQKNNNKNKQLPKLKVLKTPLVLLLKIPQHF
jgi:hypothetical protein